MEPAIFEIGGLQLQRVLYTDVLIAPEITGLTVAQIEDVPWRVPQWGEGEQLGASASAWVVDGDGRRLVLDPMFAADDILHAPDTESLHRGAIAEQFEKSQFPIESIDTVLASHIEGIGMIATRDDDGEWSPFFPNARVLVSRDALSDFESHRPDDMSVEAWDMLLAAGAVDTFADGDEIVPGLRADVSKAHNPGHTVFHFGTGPDATFLAHLAVSPLHLSTGPCPQQHPEPERAWELLHGYADDGRLLIGPLWPSPGCGRWSTATEQFS